MSGDFSPESYLKSNSWKELHQSFEECKQQLQHEIDTREMLSKLYNECDNFGTDVVRTTTLIERLSLMVGSNPHVDKTLLKDLSILLDPRGDDGYLKKEEFVDIGLKWIEMLDHKTQTNIKSTSRPNSCNSTPTKQQKVSHNESIEEEFERLTGYIFSPSNTIIQSKFSSPRGPTTHHKTLEKCIGLNKRLSMETKTLKQQLTSAEGEANYLLTENESLRKEIEDLERAFYRRENGIQVNSRSILRSPADLSLYSCDFGGLDELDDSEMDFENIKFQKQILKEENRMLRCELENQKNDIKETRHQLEEANRIVENLKKEFEESKASMEQANNVNLEKMKIINVDQEEEISKLKAELFLAQEELFKMSELHKVYPAFMDVSFDQVDFEKEETDSDSRNNSASKFKGIIVPKLSASFSTLTSSTPEKNSNTPTRVVRRSLGDEIKRLGITGSPFCDKRKSLSPNRILDSTRSNRDSSEDDNTSKEISPIKKTQLETINEDNILECDTDVKKSDNETCETTLDTFSQFAKVYLYALSIVSIGKSNASHHTKRIPHKSVWVRIFYFLAFFFILFTFFGAIEVDNKKYYPITWPVKLNSWLDHMNLTKIRVPEPVAIVSVENFNTRNVY